ncbi:hypothetical protein GCM10009642_36450 [Nocardiopsis metallicus]
MTVEGLTPVRGHRGGQSADLGVGEVHRRERRGRVDDVSAARAGTRPGRKAALVESRDVALDRADADLEAPGTLARAIDAFLGRKPSPAGD